MKKNLLLAASLFLLLTGCASSSAQNADDAPAETLASAPQATPASTPAETPAETETQAKEGSGTFISTNPSFAGADRPSVTFSESGTFVLSENLLSRMGEYSGTYTFDGTAYECTVDHISFSGFSGDDLRTIVFTCSGADQLTLENDLCGSKANDSFVRETGLTAIPSGQAYTIRPDQAKAPVKETETYTSSSTMFSSPYQPVLELNPDGTFTLTENLFEGMGHYKGTYEIDDIYVTLHVTECDFKGFAGDDIQEIHFESMTNDILQLTDDLCGSRKFDSFYLDLG